MPTASSLTSVIAWLRAGYPDGVPEHDYLPLFALLASRLTTDQLDAVATVLADTAAPASAAAIRDAIRAVTNGEASDVDVANVRAHLEAVADSPFVPPRH